MQSDPTDRPPVLQYRSSRCMPDRRQVYGPGAAALLFGVLSLITAAPRPSDRARLLQSFVGTWGGGLGLLLGVIALIQLLKARRFVTSDIIAAACGIVCAGLAIAAGLRLYWR